MPPPSRSTPPSATSEMPACRWRSRSAKRLCTAPSASEEVDTSERGLVLATARAERLVGRDESHRKLLREQLTAATALAELANTAAASSGRQDGSARQRRQESRRELLLDRLAASNDDLLEVLARSARGAPERARRPVILALALFVVFALLHLVLAERPANRQRRRRGGRPSSSTRCRSRAPSRGLRLLAHHIERVVRAPR